VGLHFSSIRIALEHTKHQNRVNSSRVAWWVFITAKQFITKPKKLGYRFMAPSVTGIHCQAVP